MSTTAVILGHVHLKRWIMQLEQCHGSRGSVLVSFFCTSNILFHSRLLDLELQRLLPLLKNRATSQRTTTASNAAPFTACVACWWRLPLAAVGRRAVWCLGARQVIGFGGAGVVCSRHVAPPKPCSAVSSLCSGTASWLAGFELGFYSAVVTSVAIVVAAAVSVVATDAITMAGIVVA